MPDVTVSRAALLREATARLQAAGVASAQREVMWLWRASGDDAEGPRWALDAGPVATDRAQAFERMVARRASGEPLAYAVGRAGFRTLELAVDRRVLIPRPETEGLVQHVLDWAAASGRWGRAADIGTGSGCIALSLATEGRFSEIIATDLSEDALQLARENAQRLGLARVRFASGDLLAALDDGRFDVIVSNPPYVTAAEHAKLEAGVREFEPAGALVGGPDGLVPTRTLIEGAASHLTEGGLLAIEVDCDRGAAVAAYARSRGWPDARIAADVFGRPRFFLATTQGAVL